MTGSGALMEPSLDMDRLSYEIFSILESKFLFGYDDGGGGGGGGKVLPRPSAAAAAAASPARAAGRVRVLSIDTGGGTDGLLAAASLARLESTLKKLSGDLSAHIADFFDVRPAPAPGASWRRCSSPAGPAAVPLFSAAEALDFLAANRHRLLRSRRPILSRIFPNRKGLSDPRTSSCTAIAALDGGLAAANPAAAAITHVLNNRKEFPFAARMENLLVVSLGTESRRRRRRGRRSPGSPEKARRIWSPLPLFFALHRVSEKTNAEKLEWAAAELVREHEARKRCPIPVVLFKQGSPRSSSCSLLTSSSSTSPRSNHADQITATSIRVIRVLVEREREVCFKELSVIHPVPFMTVGSSLSCPLFRRQRRPVGLN
ncbi:unnamed protein product [Spirodela intermedia]|uniref:Uncharacterized protein n=1 Tax=Spirodela intermedia TaxID=51605 RepID=A0A7I8JPX7_SPIIN|nr:unnamed protein product [Spirodela intermedia]CAA6671801.1 unnamed protein product [Spirodela intermedia]